MKRGNKPLVFSILLVLFLSLASAGIFDFITKTGKVPQEQQDVSVFVGGAPTIDSPLVPDPASPYDPSDFFAVTTIPINVEVTDSDGTGDLNDASLVVELSLGAVTRTASCVPTGDVVNTRTYSCTVDLNNYDEAGDWDLYMYIEDTATNSDEVTMVSYLTYNLLSSITDPVIPDTLNWPSLASPQADVKSNNDPSIVENRGNDNRNILIKAYDLWGEIDNAYIIPSTSFAVSDTLDQECVTGISLNTDGNNRDTLINANPGPNDGINPNDCDGSNEVCIYYCLDVPALLMSQTYSTTARGQQWVVLYG